MSRQQRESSLHISDIALDVRQQFGKTIDHITFQTKTGNFKKEIPVTLSPGSAHKEVFDPALNLSVRDQLFILLPYRFRMLGIQTPLHTKLTIIVKLSEVMIEAQDDNHGRKTYFKLYKDIEVTMGVSHSAPGNSPRDAPSPLTIAISSHLAPSRNSYDASSPPAIDISSHLTPSRGPHDSPSPLPPTTGEILKICPRFRLLIIGNSGVGKSTLIQKVFGVDDVMVSNEKRGDAKIDKEFVAKANGLFVLHDSIGLEGGESKNFDEIQRFITDRRKMGHLKDKLHAVWVCLAIPYANGRLLETGIENFLQKREEILGDIPIVAVLTKLDLLDKRLCQGHCKPGSVKNFEEAREIIKPYRSKFLDEHCTKSLPQGIPHVPVSTQGGFWLEPTIPELVKITTSEIERYVRADPSYAKMAEMGSLERDAPLYIAGMAQRASIEAKVDLTIALGKQRYWKNLGAGVTFSSDKVKEYLLVIHEDIIQGWNFNDPYEVLRGDDFKGGLLNTANLGARDIPCIKAALDPVMPLVSGLGALINDLIGAATAIPIASALIIVTLCIEVCKSLETIVKCFMAYIVDLTYVMKILFVLTPERPITSQDMALALKVYEKSTYRNRVHLQIRDFCANFKIVPGRDAVMEEIELLINRYSITDEEVLRIRGQIQPANVPRSPRS